MATEKLTTEYITTKEAAQLLGITDSRIRQLVMERKLKAKYWKGLALLKEDVLKLQNRPGPGKPKKPRGIGNRKPKRTTPRSLPAGKSPGDKKGV